MVSLLLAEFPDWWDIVIWCYLTRRILLRSDHSLSTELYSSVAIDLSSIEVKIVVSNIFKLCSPVRFDSQVQNQVAYISSCWSIWGNVYLRNSCLAHSVSSQRWDKIAFKLLKWILQECFREANEKFGATRIETMMQLYLTQFKTSLSVKSGLVLSETV